MAPRGRPFGEQGCSGFLALREVAQMIHFWILLLILFLKIPVIFFFSLTRQRWVTFSERSVRGERNRLGLIMPKEWGFVHIFMVSLGHLNYLKFLISQVVRPPAFDCRQWGGSGFRDGWTWAHSRLHLHWKIARLDSSCHCTCACPMGWPSRVAVLSQLEVERMQHRK